jgi:hypothetical protein
MKVHDQEDQISRKEDEIRNIQVAVEEILNRKQTLAGQIEDIRVQ